jgi:hypothetical protein
MTVAGEGVVKYRLDHTPGAPRGLPEIGELPAWHQICHRLGLIGRNPERYDGYAYGNLSRRLSATSFVISGTQTSGDTQLDPSRYALVTGWAIERNAIRSTGPCEPSSEALSHAALYQRAAAIRFIIHVHAPELWDRAAALQLPVTDPFAPYGTPEMARSIWELFDRGLLGDAGLFAMGGHQDGVIAFGQTATAAGTLLVSTLAQALLKP